MYGLVAYETMRTDSIQYNLGALPQCHHDHHPKQQQQPSCRPIHHPEGRDTHLHHDIVKPQLALLVSDDGIHRGKGNRLLQLVAEPLNNSICMQHSTKQESVGGVNSMCLLLQ